MKRKFTQIEEKQQKKQKFTPVVFRSLLLPSIKIQESNIAASKNVKFFHSIELSTRSARVFRVEGSICTPTNISYKNHTASFMDICLHPNGTKLACTTLRSPFIIDAANNYKIISLKMLRNSFFISFKWSAKGKYLWILKNNKLHLVDANTINILCDYTHQNTGVSKLICVHPTKENQILVAFENTPVVLAYDENANVIKVERKLYKGVNNLVMDPFCDTWDNYARTFGDKLIFRKGNKEWQMNERDFQKDAQEVAIDGLCFLDRDKLLFTCLYRMNEMTPEEYCACVLDFTEDFDNPKLTKWKIGNDIIENPGMFEIIFFPKMEIDNSQSEMIKFPKGDYQKVPDDCWRIIFDFLDYRSLAYVSGTCRWWNDLIGPMWKDKCFQKWKLHPKIIQNWKMYYILRNSIESVTWVKRHLMGSFYLYFSSNHESLVLKYLELLRTSEFAKI